MAKRSIFPLTLLLYTARPMANILYGVNGEGSGHSTRTKEVSLICASKVTRSTWHRSIAVFLELKLDSVRIYSSINRLEENVWVHARSGIADCWCSVSA